MYNIRLLQFWQFFLHKHGFRKEARDENTFVNQVVLCFDLLLSLAIRCFGHLSMSWEKGKMNVSSTICFSEGGWHWNAALYFMCLSCNFLFLPIFKKNFFIFYQNVMVGIFCFRFYVYLRFCLFFSPINQYDHMLLSDPKWGWGVLPGLLDQDRHSHSKWAWVFCATMNLVTFIFPANIYFFVSL